MLKSLIKVQSKVFSSVMKAELFNQNTLDLLNKAIGGLETLKDKKVITTTIVASLSEEHLEDLRVINKVPGCPNPPEDWFVFMFLRAHCRSLINTGNTLRAEKDFFDDSLPSFFGHKDIERYFYFGNDTSKNSEEIENRPGKPMLIMTKKTTAEDVKTIPLYKCLGYHHLIEKTPDLEKHKNEEEFKEFMRKYRISIVEDPMPGFPEAVDYLLEKRKFDSVLVEAGLTLIGKYLSNIEVPSPFDLIVLSVYSGKIEKEWVGHSYPSMSKLLAKHDILYKSPPFPHKDGALTIYCLTKKT